MKFVDVKNDIAFRKIFGNENKTTIIISFLNAVLKLEGDKRIDEVSIVNPYLLPRVAGEKASIIDVRAKDKKGRQFIVEMQVADVDGFDKRVQYYTCRDYSMQIDRGEQYPLLRPTYFVGILDFNFFKSPGYLSHHIILDEETYEHKLTDVQFAFIELKKFNKEVHELKTLIEKWVFFIQNAENLDVIPDHVDDEGLKEAYYDADKHNWDKEELIAYDNAAIAEQDARGRMTLAIKRAKKQGMEQGMEKGMEKGMEQGMEKSKIEVIARCWEESMPIEIISRIVNLPIPQVAKTIEQIKSETLNKEGS